MNAFAEFPAVAPQRATSADYGVKWLIISMLFIIFVFSPINANTTELEAITVCGITMNSDNELKAMNRALGLIAFSVELVEYKKPDGRIEFKPE